MFFKTFGNNFDLPELRKNTARLQLTLITMIDIKIPIINDLVDKGANIKINKFNIYSSIFEPTPKMSFKFTTDYLMPDSLDLTIGSSFPVQYSFNSGTKASETEKKDFAGLCVDDVSIETANGSNLTTVVDMVGELDYFQNSEECKAYTNKYGNVIIEDVLDGNTTIKSYARNVKKTDNVTTIYRTIGYGDIDFIKDYVSKNFVISGGQPLFFTGLDRVVNFTSVNAINETSDKPKLLLNWQTTYDDLSKSFVNSQLKTLLDDNYISLNTKDLKFKLGGKGSNKNIKNILYSFDTTKGILNKNGYVVKPGALRSEYYPISKTFMNFMKSTQTVLISNRPQSNIAFEAINTFGSPENLIAMQATINDISKLQSLVVAGDRIVVITANPYSIYNGIYTIAAVEYGQDQAAPFMTLTLIRATVDMSWAEGIKSNKGQKDWKYTYMPSIQKSNFYYT